MAPQERDTALTDLDAAKLYLGIDTPDEDDRIAELIENTSGDVSVYCGRKFARANYTKHLSGNGRCTLWLPHWPVDFPADVEGVTYGVRVDSSRQFAASSAYVESVAGSATAGAFIVHDGEEGLGRLELLSGTWPLGVRNIQVTWRGGYAEIPNEVEQACLRWLAQRYHIAKGSYHIATSNSIQPGGGSISIVEHAMPMDVKQMLSHWRGRKGLI